MTRVNASNRFTPSCPKSNLNQSKIEIAARQEIEPFTQGSLDGLCGIYSAINGLRLALHPHQPLSRQAARQLYHRGVDYLDQRRWLGDAIQHGMPKGRWHRLIRHLIKQVPIFDLAAQAETASFTKPVSIDEVFAWIADSLANSAPVLACFADHLDHYTVVVAIDGHKLHFFDSSGLQHVLRSSCGIGTGRHQIQPSALIRIAVKRTT